MPITDRFRRNAPPCLAAVALAVLVLSIYWQVGGHGFVSYDDEVYVTANPHVLRGLTREGVTWAFTSFNTSHYHPLTWLSHMADVEMFGVSAGWHHRMNLLFHLLNTELLFLVLWKMTGGMWRSAFVAALFGVHPLHVESVAWVAERKDVLSTLFFFLTMGAYLRYVRRPGPGRYLTVATTFALGLLAKPMLVTLPFVLLLLDGWPLGRLASTTPSDPLPSRLRAHLSSRAVLEKIPLLALSAGACLVALHTQSGTGAMKSATQLPFGERIGNAIVSYVAYLGKAAWPSSLAVFYPHPATLSAAIPPWQIAGSLLFLGAMSLLAFRQVRIRPYLAVGWLWYLGTLVPVIGLVQIGVQAMADRYTYIPLVGIFIAVGWGVPSVVGGTRFRQVATGIAAGASIVVLSGVAWRQAGYWRDSFMLFSHAMEVTQDNWGAMNNLGTEWTDRGQPGKAIGLFREALRIKPDFELAWFNMGAAYAALGQFPQAIDCYREATRIRPDYADAWFNMGEAYDRLGQFQQTVASYREALRIKPDYVEAANNLGVVYGEHGQRGQAVLHFREALRIDPGFADARRNLGMLGEK